MGFTKALKKIHRLDAPAVVKLANQFSEAIGLEEPPALEKSTIGKMGLKGVPGIRVLAGGQPKPGRPAKPGPKQKQPLEDVTPAASTAETQSTKPVGEPRVKRPRREKGRVHA